MKLVICEKQIAARRVANILSNGKSVLKRVGKIPYYTFTKDGEDWVVLGLKGHIVNLDYPPEFNRWRGISPLDLIWIEPYKKITNKAIADALKVFADKVSEVIIATDFDREGELIGVEAIEILKKYNKNLNIKRARFSALTRSEILSAFSNLVDIDYNLAKAAETRQIIDLVWGATLTRFVSIAARQYGKDFLSVGRVQSPTLALIVERERQIKEFVPEPYWQIVANLEKNKTIFSVIHKKDKIKNEEEAKRIYEKIKDSKKASVGAVNKSIKKISPPAPFDVTSFINAASSILKLSASRAMEIAEELYMEGWISYPRTDNTVYPKSLDLDNILHLLKDSEFSKLAEITIKNRRKVPTRGKKLTTDHPPIHPVDVPPLDKLNPEQRKVYALIVKRFLATLTKDATAEITNAEIEIKGETFAANGYKLIEPTWKLIYPIKTKEKEIPELLENEEIGVKSIKLIRNETKPPKRFTQGALVSEMEKLGLGTKSTRHEIIKKLYSRKYIIGSNPIPTATAFAVVDIIEPYEISKPDMTAQLEKDMDNIAEGKEDKGRVIKKSREMLHKVLTSLENNKHAIRSSLRKALTLQNTIGTCPSCGKPLVVRKASKSRKRFVGCTGYPDCNVTYPLPQKGRITPTNKKCPVCGSPIIRINKKEMCINPDCPSKKGQ